VEPTGRRDAPPDDRLRDTHHFPHGPAVGFASLYPPYIIRMPFPIRDNTALSRFELEAGGVTAFMTYRLAGNVVTLAHTETPVAARGRGIASQLVKGVLDEMRRRGLKIVPRCPFVSAYIAKHPEYRDLVA
jgi:predicted GNAT family acetyltransferase